MPGADDARGGDVGELLRQVDARLARGPWRLEEADVELFLTAGETRIEVFHECRAILFAEANQTCSVADFYGTMKGPMKIADGNTIPPTNKSFHVEFCTVATWNEKGEITEERLFYDLVGLMRQIGLT